MTGRSTEFFRGYDTKLVASSESRCGITGLKSNTVSAAIPIPRSYVKSRETMVELARNGEAFLRRSRGFYRSGVSGKGVKESKA